MPASSRSSTRLRGMEDDELKRRHASCALRSREGGLPAYQVSRVIIRTYCHPAPNSRGGEHEGAVGHTKKTRWRAFHCSND